MLVIPLSTVGYTRYARVSHSRQWYNYNTMTYLISPSMDWVGLGPEVKFSKKNCPEYFCHRYQIATVGKLEAVDLV